MVRQARIVIPEIFHLHRTVRYVENNPVRVKIVKKVWDYR
jgi:hypothetical protein